MSGNRFTAWATCPSCGTYACHALREPRTPGAAEMKAHQAALREWRDSDPDTIEARDMSGHIVFAGYVPPRPAEPVDESQYEVIRTCTCGYEWGQA